MTEYKLPEQITKKFNEVHHGKIIECLKEHDISAIAATDLDPSEVLDAIIKGPYLPPLGTNIDGNRVHCNASYGEPTFLDPNRRKQKDKASTTTYAGADSVSAETSQWSYDVVFDYPGIDIKSHRVMLDCIVDLRARPRPKAYEESKKQGAKAYYGGLYLQDRITLGLTTADYVSLLQTIRDPKYFDTIISSGSVKAVSDEDMVYFGAKVATKNVGNNYVKKCEVDITYLPEYIINNEDKFRVIHDIPDKDTRKSVMENINNKCYNVDLNEFDSIQGNYGDNVGIEMATSTTHNDNRMFRAYAMCQVSATGKYPAYTKKDQLPRLEAGSISIRVEYISLKAPLEPRFKGPNASFDSKYQRAGLGKFGNKNKAIAAKAIDAAFN